MMDEKDSVGPQDHLVKQGYFPDTGHALLELHRLLAIFLASKSFAKLRTEYPGEGSDPIWKLQEVEEYEITRILLYLAIVARVIDDRECKLFKLLGSYCGDLSIEGQGSSQLDLREACNKIIHAKKIRISTHKIGEQVYFNPLIHLSGETLNKRKWKAQLDVIEFAKSYVLLVSNF